MATTEEVKKLAALARIRVQDTELEKFPSEFDAILTYGGHLEALEVPKAGEEKPALRNVMRADGAAHEPEAYTAKIVEQFPAHDGDALSVKQIITHSS